MTTVIINGKSYEIITDDDGKQRFKGNRLVRHLIDTHPIIDFNYIWDLVDNDMITRGELMDFYASIGYSVNGFVELFPELEELLDEKTNDSNTSS